MTPGERVWEDVTRVSEPARLVGESEWSGRCRPRVTYGDCEIDPIPMGELPWDEA
jgi:hypothetical protein